MRSASNEMWYGVVTVAVAWAECDIKRANAPKESFMVEINNSEKCCETK